MLEITHEEMYEHHGAGIASTVADGAAVLLGIGAAVAASEVAPFLIVGAMAFGGYGFTGDMENLFYS